MARTEILINAAFSKIFNIVFSNKKFEEALCYVRFLKKQRRFLKIKNPVLYNDKLHWLKFNWHDEMAEVCADKYRVRDFVKKRIGSEYLNDMYGVYEFPSEIDFNTLPENFVLKMTHSSGQNLIIRDLVDSDDVENYLRNWSGTSYGIGKGEWVYRNIKPRIIAEKYLEQDVATELIDYRFFCFNGKVRFISVDLSINNKEKVRRNLYDLDWNFINAKISYPNEENISIQKPLKLDLMIRLSERLALGFPHVRVDFYYIADKIVFGEMTFWHQSGNGLIFPREFEKKMGDWLELN